MSRPVAILLLTVHAVGFAQNPPEPETPIIRITTTLVQIDATVTNKNGKPVTGLTKSDFQILQDGKPRDITYFKSVVVSPETNPLPAPTVPKRNEPVPPPAASRPIRRDQVRRTVAIV